MEGVSKDWRKFTAEVMIVFHPKTLQIKPQTSPDGFGWNVLTYCIHSLWTWQLLLLTSSHRLLNQSGRALTMVGCLFIYLTLPGLFVLCSWHLVLVEQSCLQSLGSKKSPLWDTAHAPAHLEALSFSWRDLKGLIVLPEEMKDHSFDR